MSCRPSGSPFSCSMAFLSGRWRCADPHALVCVCEGHSCQPANGCDVRPRQVLRDVERAAAFSARGRSRSRSRGVFGRLALGDLEARAAAARGDDVRVVDLEPGLLQAFEEVDRRALQVRRAERVDDDLDAVELELVVARLCAAVEAERVLEAAAAAALDRDPEHLGLTGRLRRHQVADLRRRALGERDDGGLGLFDRRHRSQCSRRRLRWRSFVTPATPMVVPSAALHRAASVRAGTRGRQVCSTTGCRLRSTGSSP